MKLALCFLTWLYRIKCILDPVDRIRTTNYELFLHVGCGYEYVTNGLTGLEGKFGLILGVVVVAT